MKNIIICVVLYGLFLIGAFFFFFSDKSSTEDLSEEVKIVYYSTWLWNTDIVNSESFLNMTEEYKIDTVYLYVNITESHSDLLEKVKKLIDNNISVEFLFGDPNYIFSREEDELTKIFNYIEEYNSNVDETYLIDVVHVDVEPHALKNWNSNKESYVLQFQIYMEKLSEMFVDYTINIDSAYWYDEVLFDNDYGKGNLLDYLAERYNKVTLMAYNDDSDFIINAVSYEMKKFDNIEVAVEYGDISEINTTFYDEGTDFMYKELDKVIDVYPNVSLAVHEIIN